MHATYLPSFYTFLIISSMSRKNYWIVIQASNIGDKYKDKKEGKSQFSSGKVIINKTK